MMLIELIDSNYQIHYILYLIISSFIFDFRIEIIAAAGGRRLHTIFCTLWLTTSVLWVPIPVNQTVKFNNLLRVISC